MEDQLADLYFFETGIDNEVMVTPCSVTDMTKEKWMDDSKAQSCSLCGTPFTLSVRRHHCRHCGLIYCATCCPENAENPDMRLCELCQMTTEIDQRQMSPKLYDLEPIISNPKLSKLLDAKIPFLRDEFIRVIQNSMRNDKTRDQFKEFFIHDKIVFLTELLIQALKA